MKNLKKLASVFLALAMIMALCVPAFAAPVASDADALPKKTTVTVPADSNRTYEVYQIFTGALSEGKLSNVVWGENGTGTTGDEVDNKTLEALVALVNSSEDTEKLAVIEQYVNLDSTAHKTLVGETGKNMVEVDTGYYLIKDLGIKKDDGSYYVPETEAISLYVVQIVGPTNITPKTGKTTVDKNIVEDEERVKDNNAAIGDIVTYEIVGTIPEDIANYESFFYLFTDTLSKGLTYQNDVKVFVNEVEVTDLFYKGATTENGVTTIKVGVNNLLDKEIIDRAGKIDGTVVKEGDVATSQTKVVVTYTAKLNADAVVGVDGNPNKVDLTYSNDPNKTGAGKPNNPNEEPKTDEDHPTGKTPESEVITYTTELTITKVDQDGKILTGAGFTLIGEKLNEVLVNKTEKFVESDTGEYWKLADGKYTTTAPRLTDEETTNADGEKVIIKNNVDDYDDVTQKYAKTVEYETTTVGTDNTTVEVKVDEQSGEVTFRGLKAGEYTLRETTTPAGYNTIKDIEFEIFYENGKFNVTEGKGIVLEGTGVLTTIIKNVSGSTLPETGGIGTTIFYTVGGILVVGAAVLLVTRKRVSDDQ